MRRIKVGLVMIIGCFFLLGLSGLAHASLILDEPFNNLDFWNDQDAGTGVSEISPAGQLHQTGSGSGNQALISDNFGGISGDFTCEFKFLLNNVPDNADGWYRLTVPADTHTLWAHINQTGLFITDSGGPQLVLSKTWSADTWYTLRFIVHNNQDDCDIYLNGALKVPDANCEANPSSWLFVHVNPSQAAGVNGEWHLDYLKIDDGLSPEAHVPEPATMILLGSLATGLFGIARLRKKQ